MARLPRLTLPGYPHHVLQRGNNRQAIFISPPDHQTYLDLLTESARTFKVEVHAYVLMSNHFHLLVTPSTAEGLPLMMQAVGRRYVQYFNRRHARTGTLWEGRYRSTVLQAARYLLPCMVYMDLNPVRAGLVAAPADYAWSSHAHGTGARADRVLRPHALYWALGNTPFAREAAYAALVQAGIGVRDQWALTSSTLSGWALGSEDFVKDLQGRTPRRLTPGQVGRPKAIVKSE